MNDSPKIKPSEDEMIVSGVYQSSKHEKVPTKLDDAILAMAKKHVSTGPSSSHTASVHKHHDNKELPWYKQLQYQGALAASVAIVCLVYILQPNMLSDNTQALVMSTSALEESSQMDSLSSAPIANRSLFANQDKTSLMESDMADKKRELSRHKLETTSALQMPNNAEHEKMGAISSIPNANQQPTSAQQLMKENENIIVQLTAIQTQLSLSHMQIVAQSAKLDSNALISKYLQQQQVMKANLFKIRASTENFELPSTYLSVLSQEELENFNIGKTPK